MVSQMVRKVFAVEKPSGPRLDPIQSQLNVVHPLTILHFNIIFSSAVRSSKCSLFLRCSDQNVVCSFHFHMRAE
jgi:hypothetical protein